MFTEAVQHVRMKNMGEVTLEFIKTIYVCLRNK